VQTFNIFEQISTFLTVNYPAAAAGPASGSEEPPSGAEAPLGRSLARRELRDIQFSKELSSPLMPACAKPLRRRQGGEGRPFIRPAELGGIQQVFFINWNKNEGVTHFVKWQRRSLIDTELPPC